LTNYYTAATYFDTIASSSGTALTYLCNLAGSNYELPEDDTTVSKHVGAV